VGVAMAPLSPPQCPCPPNVESIQVSPIPTPRKDVMTRLASSSSRERPNRKLLARNKEHRLTPLLIMEVGTWKRASQLAG